MATQIKIELQWLTTGFQGVFSTLNSITERFEEFNKKVNNGGAALQTAFQGALALFGVHALEGYSEAAINAARSQAQLEATLRSTGQYSPAYVSRLAEIAKQAQELTGATKGTVREIERILTQFGVGADDMQRFVMLTLDMAAAMGTDATSAAQRLGLILDGNIDKIRGFTVQVDKSLPLTERMQSVFDQLSRQIGGNAAAAFNATPKGLIEFEHSVSSLKVTLGTLYNSVVEPFFGALANGLNSVTAFWKRFNEQPNVFLMVAREISSVLGLLAAKSVTPIAIVIGSLTLLTLAMKTFISLRNVIAAFWYAFAGLGVEAISIVQARYLLFTTSIGTMTAAWGAVIAAGFAGWEAGRFLGEIKIGQYTIDQYAQLFFLGWSTIFQALSVYLKSWWAEAKLIFGEGAAALELIVRSAVLVIAEWWNKIPGVPKIDTTGLEKSLVEANNKLATYTKQSEQIAKERAAALDAIYKKTAQDRASTLGTDKNEGAAHAAEQTRAQTVLNSELARIARQFAAQLLSLSAQAARDNTATVIKNEEILYQQGLLSFEGYMKARSAAMAAQFVEDRAAIQKQISVIAEQLNLKKDELARATSEGKVAEATQLTKDRNDLQLKLQQAKDELRKLTRDNAASQLDTQLQIRQHQRDLDAARAHGNVSAAELGISTVEADPYLTQRQRVQQLLPLLNDEISAKQVLIDQLTERQSETKDEQQRIDYQTQINALLGEQVQLQAKSKELSDSQNFIGSLKRDWTELFNSISQTSKNLADLIVSPFKGLRDGIASSLDTLIEKGGTLKSFFVGVGQSIEKSMIQSFANMVADWITSNIMMLVQWAATQLGITALFAAHTATRTATHAAGEGAQTAATGTGTASRGAFRLFETIFHVGQVAVRVAAHIAGEAAMTLASLIQSAARRIFAFLEAQPYIFLAAVKAASAVADIPYVGPILAPLAAAAVFAALEAMALFSEGGLVHGPGTETSDSIPARLSRGEFVIPASRVREWGPAFFENIRTGAIGAQDLAGAMAPRMSLVPVGVASNGGGNGNVNVEGHKVNVAILHSRSDLVDFLKSSEGRKAVVQIARQHRREIGIGT